MALGRFSELREVNERLTTIEAGIVSLERMMRNMAATQADLDSAIDNFIAAQEAAQAEILAAVNDILAKVGPSVDLSAEVSRINAAAQSEKDEAAKIQGLDVQPSPTPTPTPAPEPVPPQQQKGNISSGG